MSQHFTPTLPAVASSLGSVAVSPDIYTEPAPSSFNSNLSVVFGLTQRQLVSILVAVFTAFVLLLSNLGFGIRSTICG